MTVLIPSYEPDERLLALVRRLKEMCSFPIVIVDDGSGEAYSEIFRKAKEYGCTVLTHVTNLGKGRALKTGFLYIAESGDQDGIVCADSDGQHLPEDIMRIAQSIHEHKRHIVMGSRRFTGKVPVRSRIGNTATRKIYSFTTGKELYDTQTGLRGFSSDMLEWLCSVPGERFEYEMNMLLEAPSEGYSFHEVPIDTVYLDENKSSHFRPIADSFRVYLPILKFSASSLASAALDFGLLFLIQIMTSNLLLAVLGSRICSSVCNYWMNRNLVFENGKRTGVKRSMPKYFALVVLILLLNYGLMAAFHEEIGIPLLAAKLLTEAVLFLFSYWAQRKFVY